VDYQEFMSQSSSEELRLRATEAQMRRALGLQDQPSPALDPRPPSVGPTHRPPRRFVQDGEVPVTVVNRNNDAAAGVNKLDVARRALNEQMAAREHAEQLLQEAQAKIRDVQTQLAHERLAKDEVIHRLSAEKQEVELALSALRSELGLESDLRRKAEEARDQSVLLQQKLEEQLQDVLAAPAVPKPGPATRVGARRSPSRDLFDLGAAEAGKSKREAGTAQRRRTEPAESEEPASDIVEWWKPGWKDRYR